MGGRKLFSAKAEQSTSLSSRGNSSLSRREHEKTQQLVKELWEISRSRKKNVALWLRTHLVDLPAGEIFEPFQAHREDLGRAMDCKPLGGGDHLVTP